MEDLFSLFGVEVEIPSAPETNKKKEDNKKSSETKKAPSEKKKGAGTGAEKKKKAASKKKDEVFEKGVTVYTPYGVYEYTQPDIKASDVIFDLVNEKGIVELISSKCDVIFNGDEGIMAYSPLTAATPSRTIIKWGKDDSLPVTIAVGIIQETYTKEQFSDITDAGLEVTLSDVVERFIHNNSAFSKCTFYYEPETNLIYSRGKELALKDTIEFPFKINLNGNIIEYDKDSDDSVEKGYTVEDLLKLLPEKKEIEGVPLGIYRNGTHIVVMGKGAAYHDKKAFVVNEDTTVKEAEMSFAVPFTLKTYFGSEFMITEDTFSCEYVREEQVVNFLKEQFSDFREAKKLNISFIREMNLVYASVYSGTKG